LKYPYLTWTDIRKNIFLRFDSLLVGVFFAYLKYFKQNIFEEFSKLKYLWIGIFGIICLVLWYYYKLQPGLDKDFFSKALMFQITSIFLSLIMIWLYFNFKSKSKFWYYGSIYSYSIYLMQFLFILPFMRIAHKYKNIFLSIFLLFLFIIIIISLAKILYKYFEKPILDRRPNYKF
jgi:peptidoglycan/LPS O-acetylase OafA/YrhL